MKIDGLSEKEKSGIVNILRRLDIYMENIEILKYYSKEQLLDCKLQHFVIIEIYKSPHKVLLNKLSRTQFLFRFLKTKKYMQNKKFYSNEADLEEFVKYFCVCLQNELERSCGINDNRR